MALNAPTSPEILRPRAFAGRGAEGMKKEIPAVLGLDETTKTTMNRTLLAVIACIAIFLVYTFVARSIGWKYGEGIIPTLIPLVAIIFTWRAVRGGGSGQG